MKSVVTDAGFKTLDNERGGLIDTVALAAALQVGTITGAGLDVLETGPLPVEHPLRHCPTALRASHSAWFSERSVTTRQRMAAEEFLCGLRGEPLKNGVN